MKIFLVLGALYMVFSVYAYIRQRIQENKRYMANIRASAKATRVHGNSRRVHIDKDGIMTVVDK